MVTGSCAPEDCQEIPKILVDFSVVSFWGRVLSWTSFIVGPPSRPGCMLTHMLISYLIKGRETTYCWWLKSCTTWDVWNLVNNGIINYQPQLVQDFSHQQYGLWFGQVIFFAWPCRHWTEFCWKTHGTLNTLGRAAKLHPWKLRVGSPKNQAIEKENPILNSKPPFYTPNLHSKLQTSILNSKPPF